MARIVEKEISVLSKLRHFTVVCSDVDGGLSSSRFFPILRLPSLRSFCGHMICDGGSYDEEYTEDQALDAASYVPDNVRYSNITHIHLKSSCSRRGFASLIGAPKSLESFIFEHSDNPNYLDDEGMYASRYYPPLQRHRETLQTLTLTDECTNNYTAYQIHDYDYVGSSAGFSALKELRLQISHILDWDRGWSETSRNGFKIEHTTELAEAFKDLLLGGKCCCPNLTYLEVKGNWMHVQQSNEESNAKPRPIPAMLEEFADFKVELELLCLAAGVEYRLRDLYVEDIIKRNGLYGF
ncbi:unnamed protein product [Penicillium nalgiovense]|nr:unnamed protein product [Penicillium nalgiovense]